MVSRFFKLESRGTTPFREFQAGLTTFAAMAYILAVNPSILAHAGMDKGALVTVTAITAAVATTLMALFTNYPIAMAPGMGINAFFTFTICLGKGLPWNEALGMVFINGIIFLSLSVSGIREKIIASIPLGLKIAVTCGVGLFIAFIGLKNGGVIVANKATFVGPWRLHRGAPWLCLAGIILTALLVARKVPGAIVLGILAVTIAGLFTSNGAGSTVTNLGGGRVLAPPLRVPGHPQADLRVPEELDGLQGGPSPHLHPPPGRHVRQHRDPDRRQQAGGPPGRERAPPQGGAGAPGGLDRDDPVRPLRDLDRRQLHRVGLGRRGRAAGRASRPSGWRSSCSSRSS